MLSPLNFTCEIFSLHAGVRTWIGQRRVWHRNGCMRSTSITMGVFHGL